MCYIYLHWNYITVQRFMFTSAIVSEVHLLKQKKNNEKMNKTEQLVKVIFNTYPMQQIMPFFNQLVSRYSCIFMSGR